MSAGPVVIPIGDLVQRRADRMAAELVRRWGCEVAGTAKPVLLGIVEQTGEIISGLKVGNVIFVEVDTAQGVQLIALRHGRWWPVDQRGELITDEHRLEALSGAVPRFGLIARA